MVREPMMVAVFLSAAFAFVASPSAPQSPPVLIDYFELEEHRIGGTASFRSADAPRGDSGTVFVDIVVEEDGTVSSIAPSPDSTRREIRRWYDRAERLVRHWRFRPFLREGRPVRARVRAQVEVLPPERWARRRRPFPDVPPEAVSITLARGGCLGDCPVYTVTVRGDGHVRFQGYAYTAVEGVRETSIPARCAERLIARFRNSDFWSLDRAYVAALTDSPQYRLTVSAGRRTKTVIDYVGVNVGMPAVVSELEDAVDAAAGTARWIGENARVPQRDACDGRGEALTR